MRLLVPILLLVFLPLLLQEFFEVAPWLAERLLRWAARGLPVEHRQRYEEDWLGELDAVPGRLTKLAFTFRVLVRVPATQRELLGHNPVWVTACRRLLATATTLVLAILQLLARLAGRLPDQTSTLRGDSAQTPPLASAFDKIGAEAAGVAEQPPEHAELWSAVDSLPKRQREVIVLHYQSDYTVREIASALGIAEGSVKARLYRGRAALARRLGDAP